MVLFDNLVDITMEFILLLSVARFLESRGMLEDALEVATDPDYKFDLAIQLGRLEIAKVNIINLELRFFCGGAILKNNYNIPVLKSQN